MEIPDTKIETLKEYTNKFKEHLWAMGLVKGSIRDLVNDRDVDTVINELPGPFDGWGNCICLAPMNVIHYGYSEEHILKTYIDCTKITLDVKDGETLIGYLV